MFLHNHLINIFCWACIHARDSLYWGSVAVDEDTLYITLIYCDPFYELVFTAINFHDDVFSCNYH